MAGGPSAAALVWVARAVPARAAHNRVSARARRSRASAPER
jgi:hypothetical protein